MNAEGMIKRWVNRGWLLLLLGTLGSTASAAILYQDDFATEPFATRWYNNFTADFNAQWADSSEDFTQYNATLPAVGTDINSVYVFSAGQKRLYTTDDAERNSGWYTASLDFIIKGDSALGDIGIGQYLQRQTTGNPGNADSGYLAGFGLGGNGQQLWVGPYFSGVVYVGTPLTSDVWYSLITTVQVSSTAVTMNSLIVRQGDGMVMGTSPLFTDASAGRFTNSFGYGIWANVPGSRYWTQAVLLDNFLVSEVVPEPSLLALLGIGGLVVWRRRRE